MCRAKKIAKFMKSIMPLILLPICINKGIEVEKQKTIDKTDITTESIINTTEVTNNLTTLSYTPGTSDFEVLTNINTKIDWTKLSNELPILDSDATITINPDLQQYIYNTSNEFNVPYELTLSVCYIESKFIPEINNEGTNYDGSTDYGIMGLNDYYLEANCDIYNNGIIIDPYNPYENIYIGVQILANNLNYFDGNIYDAANAYNLGIVGWEEMKSCGKEWYYGDIILEYIKELEKQCK